MKSSKLLFLATAVAGLLAVQSVLAGAVRTGFDGINFPGNDDGSTAFQSFGFANPLNFFGVSYTGGWVNNNGNVTFSGPMGTYTPFPIAGNNVPMLAPFFADVDTRAGNITQYGGGSVGGQNAWGVSWRGVGYYYAHTDLLNTFQLVVIDRSDVGVGDFDFEFNYDQIQWETGDASGGSGGRGGSPARAGWANGLAATYEVPGSGVSLALIDGGPDSLVAGGNVPGLAGRWLFQVRNGTVINPTVPDVGCTLGLLGLALAGMAGLRRRLSK